MILSKRPLGVEGERCIVGSKGRTLEEATLRAPKGGPISRRGPYSELHEVDVFRHPLSRQVV